MAHLGFRPGDEEPVNREFAILFIIALIGFSIVGYATHMLVEWLFGDKKQEK